MGFIPEDIIAQVLDRCDIVRVISSYVPVRQAGRNFKALCPFHHEKTASFVINPEKQIFHCFGCGVGGNVISFVMQQERLEFPEAVRVLAEKEGIVIPERSERDSQAPQLRQQLKKINALAAEYFNHNLLFDKSPIAKAAREYLQSRGLTLAVVKKFHLGLARESWDGLLEFLRQKDIPLSLMEKAGLVIAKDRTNGYYDRFRKRVIFPIFDNKGECVAFGGRALPGADDEVKYLNSPETPVYTKGDHLYGFNWAKDSIGRENQVVVVEGYLDFVMPFQAGVTGIVASLGTALTVEQIRLIRRYTPNLVMLYDADPAGQNAMLRSLDTLVEEGMTVRIAALTDGDDPDSFVRKYGAGRFQEQVARADTLFEFKLKYLLSHHGDKSVEARAKVSTAMLPTISKFSSEVIKSEYIKRLSQVLFVSPDVLAQEMKRLALNEPVHRRQENNLPAVKKTTPRVIRPVEENLLRLMLADSQFVPLTQEVASADDFQDEQLRLIAKKIFELFSQKQDFTIPDLMGCFGDQETLNMIATLVASEEVLGADKKRIHQDCLQRLQQDRRKSRRWTIRQEMEQAKTIGDQKRFEDLMQEFNQLIKVKG